MRIILIDDDQLVTRSLKTILESTGSVQVLATGTSGAEAIALYQQWKPDVLLLDIQMPNGSGLDAGEQILQQDPNARILFLTTFSDDAYIAKALELGAKGYLLNLHSTMPNMTLQRKNRKSLHRLQRDTATRKSLRHSVSAREQFGIISAAFWKNCSCVTAHSWRFTTIITRWTCKIPDFVQLA